VRNDKRPFLRVRAEATSMTIASYLGIACTAFRLCRLQSIESYKNNIAGMQALCQRTFERKLQHGL